MKEDRIEEMFKNLQGSFDTREPAEGHEQRFLEKLSKPNGVVRLEPKKQFWWRPLSIPASIIVLFAVSALLFTNPPSIDEQLAKISPEVSQTQFYFANLIEEQVKELTCLATNMYHEAKGEGDIGWLAVGMVTMNRMKSKRYPSTVCEVVYQNNGKVYQFSWAGTKKKLTKPKKDLYNKVKQLALLIYVHYEKLYDVTDNALFFHADYVDPYWNKSMKKTTKIGRHIFYKL